MLRLNKGFSIELMSFEYLVWEIPLTKSFGSKPGFETIANISPFLGSIAIIDPVRSPRAE